MHMGPSSHGTWGWHCRTRLLRALQGWGLLRLQGSAAGKGARRPLPWLHRSGSCLLPVWKSVGIHRCFQPDLENAGHLHLVQKRFESDCSFSNPSFLSFPPRLATCPAGTTLMQNRLDDPFYDRRQICIY